MYCLSMINHAQRKNNARKKRVGVAVNKRFKVEAYLESREQVALIDKAANVRKQSRSAFLGLAGVNEARRVLIEAEEGIKLA
jgi:uncharacterized protein (DUF1778 family)